MYIPNCMIETKIVQRFGNSGHIVLPKRYIGKRLRFIAESKTFGDIKSEILEILKPYLENILGVYLYGSYARNEQTISSDADILVIADTKLRRNSPTRPQLSPPTTNNIRAAMLSCFEFIFIFHPLSHSKLPS